MKLIDPIFQTTTPYLLSDFTCHPGDTGRKGKKIN
jgi:hypothetical protein